jgi:hypothetical protein
MREDPPMATPEHSDVVRAFFAAMNAQDAGAAAALVGDDVTIEIGPHRLSGRDAVRELALQSDDQLAFETVPLDISLASDHVVEVAAIRTQRWRNTGDVAAKDNLRASFTFDSDGTISKVVLA